ncbi:cytochrome P450 [Marasmius fiardii PR-910]|nr:cytochrome P450 [Marasmius fiardii PR-910]
MAELLESNRDRGGCAEQDNHIMNMGLISYAAGADTKVSGLDSFILVMIRNPCCQEKAWAEIDAVVGDNQPPTFSDRPSMSYIEAIYREVLRWHPPLLLGSIVLANIWGMSHDEEVYEEPYNFKPERYFQNSKLKDDWDVLAFGFGRRICVGCYFAEALMWLTIA